MYHCVQSTESINISTRKIRFTERFSRTNVLKSPRVKKVSKLEFVRNPFRFMPAWKLERFSNHNARQFVRRFTFLSIFSHIKMSKNVGVLPSPIFSPFSFPSSVITFLFNLAPFRLDCVHIYSFSSSSMFLTSFSEGREKEKGRKIGYTIRNNKETRPPRQIISPILFEKSVKFISLRVYSWKRVTPSDLFLNYSYAASSRHVSPIHHRLKNDEKEREKERIRYLSKIYRSSRDSFSRRNNRCKAHARVQREPCPRNKRAGVI